MYANHSFTTYVIFAEFYIANALNSCRHDYCYSLPSNRAKHDLFKLQRVQNLPRTCCAQGTSVLAIAAQGWVSRSQIVSQNLRSICDKHTIKLRLEKRVTGKDRKALVIHTHAQRTRSIYDDIPTLRVPDGCRRMLAVYERNQR